MAPRDFQVVVFGATGFAGELLTEYFLRNYFNGEKKIKFAIAGRNKTKLEALREKLCAVDEGAKELPILIGDSGDLEQMKAIALQTEVVATTAGPYSMYGSILVEACALTGTSYCDLTGESAWVELMHHTHHKKAEETGAHIVPGAGFDSVPSDLGSFLIAQQFKEDHGEDCDQVDNYVIKMDGGFQGGTVNTFMNEFENPTERPERDPDAPPPKGKTSIVWTKGVWYDSRIGSWTYPFFMMPSNSAVVRRSNEQAGYNPQMAYRECMASTFATATAWTTGLAVVGLGMMTGPTRSLIRRNLPDSGEGPTRQAMAEGGFTMIFVATKGEKETRMKWKAVGDPSCIATTIYQAETAICLALNRGALDLKGGVLTPVSSCGNKLWDRLKDSIWDKEGPQHMSMSKL